MEEFGRLLRRLGELVGVPLKTPREGRGEREVPEAPGVRRRPSGRSRLRKPRKKADQARLAALGLPPVPHRQALAELLELSPRQLYWLTHGRTHYIVQQIPKRGGGTRTLHVPKQTLKRAQRRILDTILSRVPVADEAHGFLRGRSISSNATVHEGQEIVIGGDLQDFFPSVTASAVFGLFQWMGYGRKMAWILALLCTVEHDPGRILPQGAPTSPAITNLVCWRMDRRLAGLARRFGANYSRYADDLAFSGGAALRAQTKAFLEWLRRIVSEEGFTLNEAKLRYARKGSRQLVTGLVVNDRVAVPRARLRRLRAILHNCAVHGVATQNRDEDPRFLQRIAGQIAFVSQIDPARGAKLREALQQLPESQRP